MPAEPVRLTLGDRARKRTAPEPCDRNEPMDIEVTQHQVNPEHPAVVVMLAGQLDVDAVGALQDTVDALLERKITRLVVDLGRLDFCDSTGLSVLVVAHHACRADGGWIRLAAPNAFLVRVLGVVGVLGRLPAYETVEGALAGDPDALIDTVADAR